MRKLVFVMLTLCLFASQAFANESKLQRFSATNNKILGYAVLKDPAKFVQKIIKVSDKVYPGSSVQIKGALPMFQAIIDKTVKVVVVFHSADKIDDEPAVGFFIESSDKTVFNHMMLNGIKEKAIVGNTLIISSDMAFLEKFKALKKDVDQLKANEDIEGFLDIKNIAELTQNLIPLPMAKALLKQALSLTATINVSDDGLSANTTLNPTPGSHLEEALTQTGGTKNTVFHITGQANYMKQTVVINYDQFKPITQDIIKVIKEIPGLTTDHQKLIDEVGKLFLNYSNIGVVQAASSVHVDSGMKVKQVMKLKDPLKSIQITQKFFELFKSPAVQVLLEKAPKEFTATLDLKLELKESVDGIKVYKMSIFDVEKLKKQMQGPVDMTSSIPGINGYFLGIKGELLYIAESIKDLKEMNVKAGSASTEADKLASMKHFKSGYHSYTDFNLKGYIIFVLDMMKKTPMGGAIPLTVKDIKALDIKPFKFTTHFNKNMSNNMYVDFKSIGVIVAKGIEVWMSQMAQMQNQGMGNPGQGPAQP